jgi:rSAM/selenodomain-associated transferase 1
MSGRPGGGDLIVPAAAAARLCVFARAPVLGRVKSRLGAAIGDQAALDVYLRLAEDTLSRLAEVPGVRTELWLDGPADSVVRQWCRRWRLPLRKQRGEELGQRMYQAMMDSLEAELRGLVVGTDCPPVDAAYVVRAVEALRHHDLVLGPAEDGGFGLIGLARPAPGLFAGVRWGGAAVLHDTLVNAIASGLRVCLLPQIWDVDTVDDWRRWTAQQVSHSLQQPRGSG